MIENDKIGNFKKHVFDELSSIIGECQLENSCSDKPLYCSKYPGDYEERIETIRVSSAGFKDELKMDYSSISQAINDVDEIVRRIQILGEFKDHWIEANPNLSFFGKEYDKYWTCLERESPMDAFECRAEKDLKRDNFSNFLGAKLYENRHNATAVNRESFLIQEWKKGLRIIFVRALEEPVLWDANFYCKGDSTNLICKKWNSENPVAYEVNKMVDGCGTIYDGSWFEWDESASNAMKLSHLLWHFEESRINDPTGIDGFTSIFNEPVRMQPNGIFHFVQTVIQYLEKTSTYFGNDSENQRRVSNFIKQDMLLDGMNGKKQGDSLESYLENKELWDRFANLTDTAANLILFPYGFRDLVDEQFGYNTSISKKLQILESFGCGVRKNVRFEKGFYPENFIKLVNANFLWDFVEKAGNTYCIKDFDDEAENIDEILNKQILILNKRAVFMDAMTQIAEIGEEYADEIDGRNLFDCICRYVLFTDNAYDGYDDVLDEIAKLLDSECFNFSRDKIKHVGNIVATAKCAINQLTFSRLSHIIFWNEFSEE